MTPETIALVIGLVEEVIKLEPAIAAEIQNLMNKPQPTPADWLALREKVKAQSFESLAPDAKLA